MVVTYHSDVIHQRLRAALFRPAGAAGLPPGPGDPADQPGLPGRLAVPPGVRRPGPRPAAGDRPEALPRTLGRGPRPGRADPRGARPGRPALALHGAARLLQGVRQRGPGPGARRGAAPDGRQRPEPARTSGRGRAARGRATGSSSWARSRRRSTSCPYYLAADAFWFPSNARSEAFGLVQVEAMASGCPVINTRIPHSGVPWVSRHEETGLTVPVNDPEALAAAAHRLLTEPGLRDRLTDAARRRAADGVRPPRHGRAEPGDLPPGARRRHGAASGGRPTGRAGRLVAERPDRSSSDRLPSDRNPTRDARTAEGLALPGRQPVRRGRDVPADPRRVPGTEPGAGAGVRPLLRGPARRRAARRGATVHRLGGVRFSRPWTVWRARRRLRRLLEDRRVRRRRQPRLLAADALRADGAAGGPAGRLLDARHDRRGGPLGRPRAARSVPDLVLVNSHCTAATLPRLYPGRPVRGRPLPRAAPGRRPRRGPRRGPGRDWRRPPTTW